MTDSVAITIDLTKLPLHLRQQIPIITGTDADQHGLIRRRGIKPIKLPSPLVLAAKTMWIVRPDERCLVPDLPVAKSIDADLNIPNALVGHNLEHGTSVFAAVVAALMLVKIWLAQEGLPREALDLLDLDCVTLRRVTVTFLKEFACSELAEAFVSDIQTSALILKKNTVCFESTNKTVRLSTKAGWLQVYNKSLLSHCRFAPTAPESEIKAWNEAVVRTEAVLTKTFLVDHGLDKPSAWRDAYDKGLYEEVFEQAVVQPLRLNLRHNYPRPEVFEKLTPKQSDFLRWYLEGGDPAEFPSVRDSTEPASAKYKMRQALLEYDIDANIPWKDHVRLRGHALREPLIYPGDHHPGSGRAGWCFCKANWPTLLARLQEAIEKALARWAGKP